MRPESLLKCAQNFQAAFAVSRKPSFVQKVKIISERAWNLGPSAGFPPRSNHRSQVLTEYQMYLYIKTTESSAESRVASPGAPRFENST